MGQLACAQDSSVGCEERSLSRLHYVLAASYAVWLGSSAGCSLLRHQGCMGDRCAEFWVQAMPQNLGEA